MKSLFAIAVLFGSLVASPAHGQTFSSGSTGADGALDLATMNCTTGQYAPPFAEGGCWIQLPPSGILNYTTINIPENKSLRFRKNKANTPVVLLAQGNVVITGNISVDASHYLYGPDQRADQSQPGPGAFPGGYPSMVSGFGPGAGTQASPHARWVGPLSLVPIVGGSGGTLSGGGGAIVIASSGSITVSGAVYANSSGNGGFGSGGAVRLVANQVVVTGSVFATGVNGNHGMIRFEAPAGGMFYTGGGAPTPVLSVINPSIVAAAPPELRIVSVAGFTVPDTAGNRKDAADLVLPKQLPDPINVVIQASNIPLGSPVTVGFGTSNQGTAPTVPLTGSLASSTATVGVTGLNRNALAYLYVQVLFSPPASGAGVPEVQEADRVAQVRMTNVPGAKPQYAFLRQDGAEVPVDKLPAHLRAWVSGQ